MESRTHIVAECELDKEERDVLEGEMRDMNADDMKSFDALDSREKTIAIQSNLQFMACLVLAIMWLVALI